MVCETRQTSRYNADLPPPGANTATADEQPEVRQREHGQNGKARGQHIEEETANF